MTARIMYVDEVQQTLVTTTENTDVVFVEDKLVSTEVTGDPSAAISLDQLAPAAGPVDFNDEQATNFCVENRTTDPVSPAPGQIWLRTDL